MEITANKPCNEIISNLEKPTFDPNMNLLSDCMPADRSRDLNASVYNEDWKLVDHPGNMCACNVLNESETV